MSRLDKGALLNKKPGTRETWSFQQYCYLAPGVTNVGNGPCTGKMAIDLLAHQSRETTEDIAIVRVELLYPFLAETLKKVLAGYPNVQEVVWVQEEPYNMGAWHYMAPQLSPLLDSHLTLAVISRPDRASPAPGFWDLYMAEQEQIITEASSMPLGQHGGDYVR